MNSEEFKKICIEQEKTILEKINNFFHNNNNLNLENHFNTFIRNALPKDVEDFIKEKNKKNKLINIYENLLHDAYILKGFDGKVCETIKKQFKELTIFNEFFEYEPILFLSLEKYRDHSLHPYYVFLTGLYILFKSEAYKYFKSKSCLKKIISDWFFVATMHDITYPVEQFDKWIREFFNKFLLVEECSSKLDLFEILNCQGIYKIVMRELMNSIIDIYGVEETDLKSCFEELILRRKDHGILSGLSFLDRLNKRIIEFYKYINNDMIKKGLINFKNISDKFEEFKKKDCIDIMRSISFHNNLYKYLNLGRKISLKEDPTTYLIILCDEIPEFGERVAESGIYLSNIKIINGTINIIFSVKKSLFKKKEKERGEILKKIDLFNIMSRKLSGDGILKVNIKFKFYNGGTLQEIEIT